MALETATYIDGLVSTNPLDSDQKAQGAAQIRLVKSTVKATFPNVAGAVTPTHTELNFVDGVTSAIQAQIDLKAPLASPALTDIPTAPTAVAATNTTQLATTAHVFAERTNTATLTNKTLTSPVINTPTGVVKGDVGLGNVDNTSDVAKPVSTATQTALDLKAPLANAALTGVPTAPTAATGTGTTQIATTAFVGAAAFSAALPAQAGNAGKFITTDNTNASWSGSLGVALNTARATVASHATTADIWGAAGNQINWTGTATTTAFPAAPQAGAERTLICAGACSFTAGANMLIDGVASAATVTCAANDTVIVRAISTAQFKLSRIKYDGTAQTSAGGGLTCLAVATVTSAVSSVDFTSGIDSTYDEYELHFINVVPAADTHLYLRTSSNAGVSFDSAANDYFRAAYSVVSSSATNNVAASETATFLQLTGSSAVSSTASHGGASGVIRIFAPSNTVGRKLFKFSVAHSNSTPSAIVTDGAGLRTSTSAINAIQIIPSSGNIVSGLFKLYGVRKSV